jgi:hypothetical protein
MHLKMLESKEEVNKRTRQEVLHNSCGIKVPDQECPFVKTGIKVYRKSSTYNENMETTFL